MPSPKARLCGPYDKRFKSYEEYLLHCIDKLSKALEPQGKNEGMNIPDDMGPVTPFLRKYQELCREYGLFISPDQFDSSYDSLILVLMDNNKGWFERSLQQIVDSETCGPECGATEA